MIITKVDPISKKSNTMDLDITVDQWERYLNRFETNELIQDIFPHLNSTEREFLITGIIDPSFWEEEEF